MIKEILPASKIVNDIISEFNDAAASLSKIKFD
jgi:hypothetical protein